MSNQELLDSVKSLNINELKFNMMLRKYQPELYSEIVKRTSFLVGDFYKNNVVPMFAILYCLEHDIHEHPTCSNPKCSNNVKWRSDLKTFAIYCSRDCQYEDDEHWNRVKNGCFEKYGVYNPGLSPEVQERMKSTCRDRYNVDYAVQSPIIQERIKSSCQKLFGVDHPLQSIEILEKTRDKCEELYWNRCMFNTSHIREKSKEKFGCEWYTQSIEYHKNRKHKFTSPKYPDMTFESNWEIKVYDFLSENNIPFEYHAEPIPYEYDGGIHYYHPDFLVNGKIYEIKGDNFFRINKETGQEENVLDMAQPRMDG